MAFQSAVAFDIRSGIPGEIALDGPTRAEPGILRTTAPANNEFGRVFSLDGALPGIWRAGDPTGNGERFGIMVNPKEHVAAGTAVGGSLAPTSVLPNETIVTIMTMGFVWGIAANARTPRVGDIVRFLKADGTLFTVAPGTAADANYADLPGATVVRFPQPSAGGLVLIQITQ